MTTVYLNDEYLPLAQAKISVLDRGFLFADGVYEVIPVYAGRLFRLQQHLARLENSLNGIHLANPFNLSQWQAVLQRLVDLNGGGEQSVYLQVTRGSGTSRQHEFPAVVSPTVFAMSSPPKPVAEKWLTTGGKAITLPDIRWQHCHLKTIALLPNVLLYQTAKSSGVDEVILLRDGLATECSASNFFIVQDGVVITPPKSEHLLPGVTRDLLLELAAAHGMPWAEQPVSEQQLCAASEIWLTSSTKEVVPVTLLNDRPVGNGQPGPLWRQMFDYYQAYKQRLLNTEE